MLERLSTESHTQFRHIRTSIGVEFADGEDHMSVESGGVVEVELAEMRLDDVLANSLGVDLRREVDAILEQRPIHAQAQAEEVGHQLQLSALTA